MNTVQKKLSFPFDTTVFPLLKDTVTKFFSSAENTSVLSALPDGCAVFPGFCDVHVHFREPGFSYKETIRTGSLSAAAGGYTAVCTMPNLNPVPDSLPHLQEQLDIIHRDAVIDVLPYGSITVGQKGEILSDMAVLASHVIAFSDDGRGVQSDAMMEEAMKTAKAFGKLLVAHCEDNSLLRGGYIHDGLYAAMHGHRGICSESEYRQVARDLELAAKVGCAYHVCHISTEETVDLIRQAKKSGVDVTCETGPHYLILSDENLEEDGRFKMNPPLRGERDRIALLEGVADGTIDMIATDHAPHSAEEKSKGLADSLFGIVGLETAFPILYTDLVRTGILSVDRLLELLCYAPRKRFGIPVGSDFTVFDLEHPYEIDPAQFISMGKATPFTERTVFGRCKVTVHNGKVVYTEGMKA